MTTIVAGQSLLQALLDAAPVKPDLLSTDEDGNTGVEWTVKDRVVQLEVAPDTTTAQWLTWRESEPLQDLPFQELDLRDAETWPPLLELLYCYQMVCSCGEATRSGSRVSIGALWYTAAAAIIRSCISGTSES